MCDADLVVCLVCFVANLNAINAINIVNWLSIIQLKDSICIAESNI